MLEAKLTESERLRAALERIRDMGPRWRDNAPLLRQIAAEALKPGATSPVNEDHA